MQMLNLYFYVLPGTHFLSKLYLRVSKNVYRYYRIITFFGSLVKIISQTKKAFWQAYIYNTNNAKLAKLW